REMHSGRMARLRTEWPATGTLPRSLLLENEMKAFLRAILPLLALAFESAPLARGQDLLVSSRFSDQILRYDAVTGAFLGAFASGGGLSNPVGEGFGPDGNLYVVSKNTRQILRYDGSSGAFLGVFVDDPTLVEARHLAFGPDGNLYVSQVSPEG